MPKSFLLLGIVVVVILALFLATLLRHSDNKVNYQAVADAARWEWSQETASVKASSSSFLKGYEIETDVRDLVDVVIHVKVGGKHVFSWKGHEESVFLGFEDLLYYADFDPASSGCSLVAVDLQTGHVLWTTQLKGLGPLAHMQYRSKVSLRLEDTNTLRVTSIESGGGYLEFVDRETGKTVGHHIFSDDEIPWGDKTWPD